MRRETTTAAELKRRRPAPLLPRRDGRSLSLVIVVGVLSLLACLAGLAALAGNRAAGGWTRELTGAATVVVRPSAGETPAASAARAAEALSGVPGVAEAAALEPERARALLDPWLGAGELGEDLPIPQLVTVTLEPDAPASRTALLAALQAAELDATVDDHRRWRADIERAGAASRAAAIAGALLIAWAAGAVIAFATKSGLAARRDVVEVLHLAGARDGYVARLFQWRFAALAGTAGLIGAAGAAALAAVARALGGEAGFTPALPVAWTDLLLLVPVPLVAALVAASAARLTALRILRSQP